MCDNKGLKAKAPEKPGGDASTPPKDRDTPPPLSISEQIAAVGLLLIICSTYYLIPLLFAGVGYLLYVTKGTHAGAWTVLAITVTSSFLPAPPIAAARKAWVLRAMAKYFNFVWIDDAGIGLRDLKDEKGDKKFMAVWFPHGIIPLGGFLAASEFDERLPGYFGRMAVAPALLRAPFLRTIFGTFGAIGNDRKSMIKALERDHLSLFPGGIAEIFLSAQDQEAIYLERRKGFVKLALQTGTHIIPVYVFGHSHMFSQVSSIPWVAKASRFFRLSVTLFWGRFFLPLPYRTPVTFVRGSPIFVDKVDQPTKEQVDAVHDKVKRAVQELYNRHRGSAGSAYATKNLTVT